MPDAPGGTLYYGDNLDILARYVATSSVDVVYLDPPFNSNRSYNVLFKESDVHESEAQIEAFLDSWHWGPKTAALFEETCRSAPDNVAHLLSSLVDGLGNNDISAYLVMMTPRLLHLHRVLKPTGTIFLHCDPTASHYLKIIMDAIFGPTNFRNEIVWRRSGSHNKVRRFGPIHDTIFFYSKSSAYKFNTLFRPYMNGHVADYFKMADDHGRRYWTNALTGAGVRSGESGLPWNGFDPTPKGRHWAIPGKIVEELGIDATLTTQEKLDALNAAGFIRTPPAGSAALPTYVQYLDSSPGMPAQDIWAYQPHTSGVLWGSTEELDRDVKWLTSQGDEERLGYPTQKPLGLLRRIIESSSSPGDVILDPFCGCGTAVDAAHGLNRRWIGIDITHLAIGLIRRRLEDKYDDLRASSIPVVGEPVDTESALELARQDKYQFQWWAVDRLDASPVAGERKKGKDRGIDGVLPFFDSKERRRLRIIVSVKGGGVGPTDVRDLRGVLQREKDAPLGILVTASVRTREMEREAASAGVWTSAITQRTFPVIQIVTAADLIHGRVQLPGAGVAAGVFRKAKRDAEGSQVPLV